MVFKTATKKKKKQSTQIQILLERDHQRHALRATHATDDPILSKGQAAAAPTGVILTFVPSRVNRPPHDPTSALHRSVIHQVVLLLLHL